MINAKAMCDYLNEIHAIDNNFLQQLTDHRVPVSNAIVKSQVMCALVNGAIESGFIGVLNGFVEGGFIAASYTDGNLEGFCVIEN